MTSGVFLIGLLFFLRGIQHSGGGLVWRAAAAGAFIGFALASSPRALTLVLASLIATLLVAVCFPKLSKSFFLASVTMFPIAMLIQTFLLLPWGENTISWYLYLKRGTRADRINATPLVGQGSWDPDLHHHQNAHATVLEIILLFVRISATVTNRVFRTDPAEAPASRRS